MPDIEIPHNEAESIIDNATTPEGEAELEKALLDDMRAAGDKGIPAGDSPESETKEDTQEPETEDEPDEHSSTEETPASDEPEEEGDDETPKGETPTKTGKRIEKLLSQRNSARHEAEEAQRRAEEAERKLNERGEKTNLPDASSEGDGSVEDMVNRELDRREAERERQERKTSLDREERSALLRDYPNAKDFESEIEAVLEKHPTLSDVAAYRIVNPMDFAEGNDRRLESGTATKRDLFRDKSPNEMTTEEMEAHLRQEMSSGNLKV